MSKFKAAKEAGKLFEYYFDRLLRGFRKDQGREPENLEMILIRQEAGNKAKEADKVVEVQFGKPFGEEVNKLIESGDVKIGEVTKKNDNVLTREMVQNSNLNKPTIEGQMEKITNASNRIDEIMKEQADMYRPKTDEEIAAKFERQNKEAAERLRKKMKDEPEDKADGGRMGFAGGKIVLGKKILDLLKNNKKIQEAVDNIFGTGDYKMDAEMAAESLVELNPKTFGNKLYEDLDDATRMEIYGAVLRPITTNMAKMRELKKASKPTKTLESIKETGTIDISDPNVADEFARFMKETDPEGSKKLEQTVELANFDPKGRKKNATGGRAGFYTGGITDVEPSLDDIGHGSDSLMSRTRLMSPGSQATTSTGLNYLLAEDNDNLRIPFSKGKLAKEIVDKGRRGFMKAAGAAGAGIAALKTGLLGLGEKVAPATQKVMENFSSTASEAPGYFFDLVTKIKSFGKQSKVGPSEMMNEYSYTGKNGEQYTLIEDIVSGDAQIVRDKMGVGSYGDKTFDTINDRTVLEYKAPKQDIDVDTGKGTREGPEYEEYKVEFDSDGTEAGAEAIDEITQKEILEEASEKITKKAEGGRIGFSKGKLVFENAKKFLEKVFGKENMAEMPNRDPEMYQGMLEVVDMFRNRDKEGLKKYLQKFLPHMDDAQIEDFIVGDAEDMAGLGKFGLGNLQGQLIRLGSGRGYAGKIEAFKRLERNKELKDLEVTEDMQRKPNASGGLAKMLGE